ncbi:DUF7065 domain-containing protein [Aquihabitans sp. McL0605]|uniref:DUF7064 domain-containing protein n=1 Tax=Aquihabitans sp. McL0605 TaxID=3415671 RepID=UPI003CF13EE2
MPEPTPPAATATPADPADEARHAPTDEHLWSESWYLDFVDEDQGIAGYVRLGLYPGMGRAWYWACVVGPDRPLVTVIDHDVAIPPGRSHEIRTEGLWADYTVETALDHVSVGVEAFAVGVDDPTEVYGDLRGDRVPLGFDLEWETVGSTFAYPGVTRYEVPCRVHGEVLVGSERIELDGLGQRDHSWGVRDWWSYGWSWTAGWLDDGTRFHGVDVHLGTDQLYGTGYVQSPSGLMAAVTSTASGAELGRAGLPEHGTWTVGDLELQVEPVAWSPVLLTSDDAKVSRFPRAWCRFTAADGRVGHGWTEWNQPEL